MRDAFDEDLAKPLPSPRRTRERTMRLLVPADDPRADEIRRRATAVASAGGDVG